MGQGMHHIGYKQNRQLPIAETGPVSMCNKNTVHCFLNIHLLKVAMISGIVSILSIFGAIINLQDKGFYVDHDTACLYFPVQKPH